MKGVWLGAGGGVGLRDAGVGVWEVGVEEHRATRVGGEIGQGCAVGGGPESKEAEGCG